MFNKTRQYFRFLGTLLTAGVLMTACADSSSSSSPNESGRTISGTSQKGPFIQGSKISLYEMDENLHQTGTSYTTTIDNNQGNYTLNNVTLNGRYAWLNVSGYFIDELTGEQSLEKISLNSLVDLKKSNQVNINALTHLSFDRILYLVKNGTPVAEAKKQAESEVMNAFGFSDDIESFEQLDLLSDTENSSKLLAISMMVIMSGARGGAATTDRLANIAFDLETDGVLDNDSLKKKMGKEIAGMSQFYDINELYSNLAKIGIEHSPNFQKYLKSYQMSQGFLDTLWGNCNVESEVEYFYYADTLRQKYLCKNGGWIPFRGPREKDDGAIDTTGRYGTFTDPATGTEYKTVVLDKENGETAIWMVELLNYPKEGSHQGYQLYTAAEAFNISSIKDINDEFWKEHQVNQGICPDGWHIPTRKEFVDLFVGYDQKRVRDNKELIVFPYYIFDIATSVLLPEVNVYKEWAPSSKVDYYFFLSDYEKDYVYAANMQYLTPLNYNVGLEDIFEIRSNDNEEFSIRCAKD